MSTLWTLFFHFDVTCRSSVAADVSGKWSGEVPGRGGQTAAATFVFKVDGDKLTGTMTGPQGEVPCRKEKSRVTRSRSA